MPTFPGFTASTPPPRSSGLARAQNIGALTQSSEQAKWSGVGAFGRGMSYASQLSFQASQHRQALDDDIEWGTATTRVKDKFRLAGEAAERLDVSMDMPLPDDPDYLKTLSSFSTTKRDQFLTESLKDIEKDVGKLSRGFSNPKNRVQFENWYNDNYRKLASGVQLMFNKKLDSYQRSEISRLSETAAENGDLATADHYVELMDKRELITPERAEVLKQNNKVIADTNTTYKNAQAIMAVKGYREAVNFVMAQDIDIEIKKKIRTNLNFEAAQQTEQVEIQREKDRDEISKLIRSGQSAEAAIENSYLDEKEQWTWFERERAEAARLVKGELIETNQTVKGDLEAMAYDIHNGSVSMQDFVKRLEEERYDKKGIDDSDYDELRSLAEREFKSYQSNEMKARIQFARNQLITMPDELTWNEFILRLPSSKRKPAIALRKLELNNLDLYRKALNDWLKGYPDATADEIYDVGRRLLSHYKKYPEQLRIEAESKERMRIAVRKRGQEELKKAKEVMGQKTTIAAEVKMTDMPDAELEQKFRDAKFTDPEWQSLYNEITTRREGKGQAQATPEELSTLPAPKTKEEYDKLDPGTKYIDPEGNERIKR